MPFVILMRRRHLAILRHTSYEFFCISQTCHTKVGEQYVDNVHMLEENIFNYAYLEPASSWPTKTFLPSVHIKVGHCVLLRISEECHVLVWMERMISKPNLTHLNPHVRSIELVYYAMVLNSRYKKASMSVMRNVTRQNILDGQGSRNMPRITNP
jgi:hypothetical protein